VRAFELDSPACRLRFHDLPGSDPTVLFVHGLGCAAYSHLRREVIAGSGHGAIAGGGRHGSGRGGCWALDDLGKPVRVCSGRPSRAVMRTARPDAWVITEVILPGSTAAILP
jgi:hypothetical protein